jgi:hypothetical protein
VRRGPRTRYRSRLDWLDSMACPNDEWNIHVPCEGIQR